MLDKQVLLRFLGSQASDFWQKSRYGKNCPLRWWEERQASEADDPQNDFSSKCLESKELEGFPKTFFKEHAIVVKDLFPEASILQNCVKKVTLGFFLSIIVYHSIRYFPKLKALLCACTPSMLSYTWDVCFCTKFKLR